MTISGKDWQKYIDGLRKVNDAAADLMAEYLKTHSVETYEEIQAALDYAYALATKYGEGAAALACEMYDRMAEVSGVALPPAVPVETASYHEVAKAVRGAMKQSANPDVIASAVGRQVKMAGVDTTMQNALRDGAEWAWIPRGDTCAFCLTLASRGWQKASKAAIKNGHAEHIHANCDCTYAVRFDGKSTVDGYDPDALLGQYEAAGDTPQDRINAMRRKKYAQDKAKINAQKRRAYAERRDHENALKGFINKNSSDIINIVNGSHKTQIIPNAITASTVQDKIQKYALNSNHPVGKHKAIVLNSVLGFNYQNWEELSNQIFDKLQTSGYTKRTVTEYGIKYLVPMRINGKKGNSMVVNTVWQIDKGSNIPRFITLTFDKKSIRSI